ncbi:2-hydroxy-acid oxidase [Defluviimonas sp. 20V17]|uniref:2-hydroxy-acid oxidase n=1 Tax=Allgaiera indica TaxID=765699 RepID=A0AAN5A105_9RHOB|nr:FAD-binding protein [Allgaiera indica]KDB04907.1 2-hydroxy-acid oxidase [Defluviimonas sp. 20V17]GHE05625.1 2-hydroxy-acid oxidase [Allgaiera indica]SDX78026.1 glycolate oxidase FAD binding subunit [Allgaiera indica]
MKPASEAELAEAVRGAAGPLVLRGGGTRSIGRPVRGEVLETGGLSGIRLYEPGALTLVAGAGTPLAEIEAVLAAEGQRLPFEAPDMRGLLGTQGESTIGGVVAANASGPRRVQAGACRDSLIGVRFVDGAGTVVKNGGRVMKNVTGYDLVKLLAGSHGTLGVLSEVSFKVLPVPETAAGLIVSVADPAAAVRAMAVAMASPYEVTGAAWLPGTGVVLRIEGFAASVSYRAGKLTGLLAEFGTVEAESGAEAVAARWAAIRDVVPLQGGTGDIWRLSVKPSDAPGVLARLGAEAVMLDWAGGLIWARAAAGEDLRARMGAQGHATLVRADAGTRVRIAPFHPEPGPLAAIAAGLRAKFDPRGILNPGIMG